MGSGVALLNAGVSTGELHDCGGTWLATRSLDRGSTKHERDSMLLQARAASTELFHQTKWAHTVFQGSSYEQGKHCLNMICRMGITPGCQASTVFKLAFFHKFRSHATMLHVNPRHCQIWKLVDWMESNKSLLSERIAGSRKLAAISRASLCQILSSSALIGQSVSRAADVLQDQILMQRCRCGELRLDSCGVCCGLTELFRLVTFMQGQMRMPSALEPIGF